MLNIITLQGKRKKNLFWLASIAPLVSVILSTLVVFLTRADKNGVKIVKHVKGGLNPSSINQLDFNSPHVIDVAKIGLIVAVVALTVSKSSSNDYYICFKIKKIISIPFLSWIPSLKKIKMNCIRFIYNIISKLYLVF